MALAEIQQVYRHNVLETLELLALREEQLKYQREVPIAYVSGELFCLWEECFQAEFLEDELYCAAFSSEEMQTMETFDDVLNQVTSFFPESVPPIEDFVLMPQWEQLSQAAHKALLDFRHNDL